jgi:hypothetical protein
VSAKAPKGEAGFPRALRDSVRASAFCSFVGGGQVIFTKRN